MKPPNSGKGITSAGRSSPGRTWSTYHSVPAAARKKKKRKTKESRAERAAVDIKRRQKPQKHAPTNADIGRRQGFRGRILLRYVTPTWGGGYESRVPRKPRRQMPTLENLSYSPKHKEPEKKKNKHKRRKKENPRRQVCADARSLSLPPGSAAAAGRHRDTACRQAKAIAPRKAKA